MSKERPILFNTEMVQAILSGRKTQTRRVMNPQPKLIDDASGNHWWPSKVFETMLRMEDELSNDNEYHKGLASDVCPNFTIGDVLWVREAFYPDPNADSAYWDEEDSLHTYYSWSGCGAKVSELPEKFHSPDNCIYRASWHGTDLSWRPSIHMPRWAARIFLEVTNIRCQRLQDISEDDAKAEGFASVTKDGQMYKYGIPDNDGLPGTDNTGWPWHEWEQEAKTAFAKLWQAIYQNWDENPWVWVVEFKVAKVLK